MPIKESRFIRIPRSSVDSIKFGIFYKEPNEDWIDNDDYYDTLAEAVTELEDAQGWDDNTEYKIKKRIVVSVDMKGLG